MCGERLLVDENIVTRGLQEPRSISARSNASGFADSVFRLYTIFISTITGCNYKALGIEDELRCSFYFQRSC